MPWKSQIKIRKYITGEGLCYFSVYPKQMALDMGLWFQLGNANNFVNQKVFSLQPWWLLLVLSLYSSLSHSRSSWTEGCFAQHIPAFHLLHCPKWIQSGRAILRQSTQRLLHKPRLAEHILIQQWKSLGHPFTGCLVPKGMSGWETLPSARARDRMSNKPLILWEKHKELGNTRPGTRQIGTIFYWAVLPPGTLWGFFTG